MSDTPESVIKILGVIRETERVVGHTLASRVISQDGQGFTEYDARTGAYIGRVFQLFRRLPDGTDEFYDFSEAIKDGSPPQ